MKERIWTKGDIAAGAATGLASLVVYLWTAAPNVTLLDSGEFIVAAQHFGVPHPTGYPLWTLLAWIFQLLPLGNAAWEINIFSGVCGGLAVGVMTTLTRSTLRWLVGSAAAPFGGLVTLSAVCAGLLFAFSFSMWSQATIAEVYTLHALGIGLFLTSLYAWLRRPSSLLLLLLGFCLLALTFSNHHLTIALAPLPFLAVLLVRREWLWDLLIAAILTALLGYLCFAILSGEVLVLKTALRFFYCVAIGLVARVILTRGRMEWRLIAYLPFAVAIGLLPYAYMPLASSTNPPMNWAYTRTPEGFYYSFNRSQYSGALSHQSLRSLGRLMGTTGPRDPAANAAAEEPGKASLVSRLQEWAGFFWIQLGRSFTPLGVIGYFLALLVIFRLTDVARRTWIYILEFAFVLAAFLQPVADGAGIDRTGWWLQMPYHTYTNLIFGILAAIGLCGGAIWFFRRFPRLTPLRFALLALPLMPLWLNYDGSSQRGRWFGWQFGHDMLKDLPKDSVVLGGTDPGRFVPTYMILGESTQAPELKRDPDFDRRDLFIITQNGVGEPLYRRYLRDHYTSARPAPKNAFERWLGREQQYPTKNLDFPTEAEVDEAIKAEVDKQSEKGELDPALPHSVVSRLIWEKNRDRHAFFVEESFPLTWSYDHAVPHGLIYEIRREPLKELPPDVVAKDMSFWQDYATRLLEDPEFSRDYDAQRSFSKLRSTTGNLYRHRKMDREAEIAYRQALALWRGNPDALNAMITILWARDDIKGVSTMMEAATFDDPNNVQLWRLRALAERRQEIDAELAKLRPELAKKPDDGELALKILVLYAEADDTNRMPTFLKEAIPNLSSDANFLRAATRLAGAHSITNVQLQAAEALVKTEPAEVANQILLAQAAAANDRKDLLIDAMRKAVETGGLPARNAFEIDPIFDKWRNDADFTKLLGKPTP